MVMCMIELGSEQRMEIRKEEEEDKFCALHSVLAKRNDFVIRLLINFL